MMRYTLKFLTIVSGSALFLAFAPSISHAQSVSPSVSDSLSTDTATGGLDNRLTGADVAGDDLHSDVSDPTHSQLLGSALSPGDFAYPANPLVTTSASTSVSDSQSTIGANDFSSGRSRSQSFHPGGSESPISSSTGRQDLSQAQGTATMVGAFTGVQSRSAFSGMSSRLSNTGQGFSGQGVTAPVTANGVGATQTLVQMSPTEAVQGYVATDPVLTQQAESTNAGLQLGTDMMTPYLQVNGIFSYDLAQQVPRYEYDDGQTPPIATSLMPRVGTILGIAPEYLVSTTGFPDSTKGTAALPTEASTWLSSTVPLRDASASPFLPVSDGTVYGVKVGLNPTIRSQPEAPKMMSFRTAEKRAQEERILHGMSISDSAAIYQSDLREYQRNGGRGKRRSTLQEGQNDNQAPAFQTTFHKPIR